MIWLVARAVRHLELILAHSVENVALLTQIKVKAIVAFVPDTYDWHSLAALALNIFTNLMARFND